MNSSIEFFVPGLAAPGGSKKFVGFAKATGHAILVDDAGKKNKNWRQIVSVLGLQNRPPELFNDAIEVAFLFIMPRPKAHFRTGKFAHEMREDAPLFHTKKPDVLKLSRSTEDALTNVIWTDDSITSVLHAKKVYGDFPGCHIFVKDLKSRDKIPAIFL